MKTKLKPKKLLTAAVGVATVSYVVGCGATIEDSPTSGNLIAPPDPSAVTESNSSVNPGGTISGNLMPPPTMSSMPVDLGVISGNLVAPPDWTTTPVGPTSEPPPPLDTGIISGNLMPPPTDLPTSLPPVTTEVPSFDAGVVQLDAAADSGVEDAGVDPTPIDAGLVISGNLLPPPSFDAEPPEEP